MKTNGQKIEAFHYRSKTELFIPIKSSIWAQKNSLKEGSPKTYSL